MHIKVNFVGAFMGVPCDENTTVEDVIDFILDHNDINTKYANLCAILEIRSDNFGYPLALTETMTRFEGKNCLHFRVLNIPTALRAETLDVNFLELLHNQVHRLVVSRTWTVPDAQTLVLAGYRCGIEFGDFNPNNHKVGFLQKTIEQLIPADILISMLQKDVEQIILDNWQKITGEGKTKIHQKAVINYLQQCQDTVKQYGTATFVCRLVKIDQEEKDIYIYYCLKPNGYLFLDPEGSEIASFSYEDAQVTYPLTPQQTNLTICVANRTYELEMNGIMAMKQVMDFLIQSKIPE